MPEHARSMILCAALLVAHACAADAQPPISADQLFALADRCMACHNGLVDPAGADVAIGSNWRASMMAHSARDPYWQASVRREVLDHPSARDAIEDECAICHMPMAGHPARASGRKGEVFRHLPVAAAANPIAQLAVAGVSCTACHQITDDKLGTRESFVGRFTIDTATPLGQRKAFGPFEIDRGRETLMRSASRFVPSQADHIQGSELCATCHTLYTHSLDSTGAVIDELPEQVPYLEWRHSDYLDVASCQSCHMPDVPGEMPISGVLGQPRRGLSRHTFDGGNFFMPRVLSRYAADLFPQAPPAELELAVRRTVEHLQTSGAEIHIEGATVGDGRLLIDVTVRNLAGHKLPTAYPSRRAWVRIGVRDDDAGMLLTCGDPAADGAITGNDNDADPLRYEPHYAEIASPDQVQIYEAIMADPDGDVTTGLLTAVRFVKDNRLLPSGFDKATAGEDIAVRGDAAADADFQGGSDTVRYAVPLGGADGPFTVEAELWYQPIAYRWAHNLAEYPADEPARFVAYYRSLSASSTILLARDTLRTQ